MFLIVNYSRINVYKVYIKGAFLNFYFYMKRSALNPYIWQRGVRQDTITVL